MGKAEVQKMVAHSLDAVDFLQQSDEDQAAAPPPPPALKRVSLADVFDAPEPPQRFVWADRIPCEHVTLLGAHGGTGKSMLALQLAAHVAIGRPFLGNEVEQGRVLFFSAEDAGPMVRRRFARVCRADGLDPAEVAQNLEVIDASDAPTLYEEANRGGVKLGAKTPAFLALQRDLQANPASLLVIDNASDTFGASEIERARVREFVRELSGLVKANGGAVLLLVHVPKVTARSRGKAGDEESYSGSTAWHNSARSRLFMSEPDGASGDESRRTIAHQKCNVGPKAEPLEVAVRPDGTFGLWVPVELAGGIQGVIDRAEQRERDTHALLRLVHEFFERGEYVSPNLRASTNAHAMFKNEAGFPGLSKDEVTTLLREAQRIGLVIAENYTNAGRKPCVRWALTEAGLKAISAPGAPGAPGPENKHPSNREQGARAGAPGAPGPVLGGVGERARTTGCAEATTAGPGDVHPVPPSEQPGAAHEEEEPA